MKTDDNVWRVVANAGVLTPPVLFEVPIEANLGEFIQILVDSGFIEFDIREQLIVATIIERSEMNFSVQQDASDRVVQEGLAYAVQNYCGPETFSADPKLEALWRAAALACNKLETYLAPFASDELTDRTADIEKLKKDVAYTIQPEDIAELEQTGYVTLKMLDGSEVSLSLDRVLGFAQVALLVAWELVGLYFDWSALGILILWFVGLWSFNVLTATAARTYFKLTRPQIKQTTPGISEADIEEALNG